MPATPSVDTTVTLSAPSDGGGAGGGGVGGGAGGGDGGGEGGGGGGGGGGGPDEDHVHVAEYCQSSCELSTALPCSCAVAVPLAKSAADSVICAITIGSLPLLAPIVPGSMKNTALFVSDKPVVAVHSDAMSKPGDAVIAPGALPSVMPIVSHESNSVSGAAAINAAGTPPMSAPNGAATWYAGGNDIVVSEVPAIAYTFA